MLQIFFLLYTQYIYLSPLVFKSLETELWKIDKKMTLLNDFSF